MIKQRNQLDVIQSMNNEASVNVLFRRLYFMKSLVSSGEYLFHIYILIMLILIDSFHNKQRYDTLISHYI